MAIRSVLTVCLGNICRSPMAEALLSAALPDRDVSSAGLGAMVGYPADPIAQELLHERGVNIGGHRARQISLAACQRADLILVMDTEQRRAVERLYPFTSGKVFRLCEHAQRDVPDPYQAGRAAFQTSLTLIEEGAAQWANRISRVSR